MIKFRRHLNLDIPYRVKWLNDPKVNKFTGDTIFSRTSLIKENKWFEEYVKSKNKKFFTICDGKLPIGFMGLSNISKINKNADLFIVIGEEKYRGKGIGKIAVQYLLEYAFKHLKLHKLSLTVISENIPAVKLYKSLGFVVEGIIKDQIYYKGKYYNNVAMAIFNKKI